MSLDGYIAGPKGEFDWIITDPEIDFGALFSRYDTLLIGRRTFETMLAAGNAYVAGMKQYVFSRTLKPQDYPAVTIVASGETPLIHHLKNSPGKDIWLFGGGELFRHLASAGLVDAVDVTIVPVLLGGGLPLLPPPAPKLNLKLTRHKLYKSGLVSLTYEVQR
jgi:dihydrofolate reductase